MKKIMMTGDVVSNSLGTLLDWIGMTCIYPDKVRKTLEDAGNEEIEVTLSTPGGSVFMGQEIYNLIKSYEGNTTVKIAGLVASIGTLITCAFDKVQISPVATFMIHNPTIGDVSGEKKDMEQAAQVLNTIETTLVDAYSKKTGLDKEGLADLMDNQTFMTAQEAMDYGFADEVLEEEKELDLVASFESSLNSDFIDKIKNLKENEEREQAEARLRFLKLQEENK